MLILYRTGHPYRLLRSHLLHNPDAPLVALPARLSSQSPVDEGRPSEEEEEDVAGGVDLAPGPGFFPPIRCCFVGGMKE